MRFLAPSLLLTALLSTAIAHADDDPKRRAEAEARHKEGIELYNAHKEDEAKIRFEQAYAVLQNPNILYMLARTEQLTSEPLKAYRHYRLALSDAKLFEKNRRFAEKYVQEVAKQLGVLTISATGSVRIAIDGEAAATGENAVLPGVHTVVAIFPSGEAQSSATVGAGEPAHVTLAAPAEATTPSVAPSARPMRSDPAPRDLDQKEGDSSARGIVATSLLVGGLALAGVGVGFRVSAGSAESRRQTLDLENPACSAPSSGCQTLSDATNDRVSRNNVGLGLLVGGAAVLGAGVATWFLWPERERSKPPVSRVSPMVAPGVAGAVWAGRF